jgi:hypothetical protein
VALPPWPSYVLLSFTLREEKFTLQSIRNPRTFVTAIAAAFVALALTAPVASAWTPENEGFNVQGTLTLKRGGTDARTCSVPSGGDFGKVFSGDRFEIQGSYYWESLLLKCTNGLNLKWYGFSGDGFLKEGKQMMAIVGRTFPVADSATNPWGESFAWSPTTTANLAWNNATAVTASNVVFSETKIGTTASGSSVTASGTLYFRTGFSKQKLTLP